MNSELSEQWSHVMMHNYGVPPLAVASGRGSRVTDADGREYLDFVAGIAVSVLGHGHPAVVEAVRSQVANFAHTSNLFMHEPGIRLAQRLIDLLDRPARVFFSNDGATANECALKISRMYGWTKDPSGGRLTVVSTENSFHGRTLGSLAITGNAPKRIPFEPLPGPVRFVEYGNVDSLAAALDSTVAALFLEPTQGEGGVVPAPDGYLAAARRLCDEVGALLVIDEVQSGIGRTGEWFASTAAGITPDIITLAKGLGGGLPIGACIGIGAAGEILTPGSHGSTFGGNPVSCAAALAVLDTIASEGLLDSVGKVGAELETALRALSGPLVAEIRGSGLWWGIVLSGARANDVEVAAREHGLLVNAVKPNVVRLVPPLIVTSADVQTAARLLQLALDDVATRDKQAQS